MTNVAPAVPADQAGSFHPLVALMRGFVVDWLDRADAEACRRIMDPGYTAVVGGVALRGRDEAYIPGTTTQLRRFPGLLLTVHELFTSGDHVALRFTEHGAAVEREGAQAAWAGIGIFGWDGIRLTWNVTEEDYFSRRRQLASGTSDPVATPATAPWSARPEVPRPDAEDVVRRWLAGGDLTAGGRVSLDDGWTGQPVPALVAVEDVEIDTMFSAGSSVAFHATQRGRYLGGIGVADEPVGVPASLRCCGMVTVDGSSVNGHVVRDRVGLRRDLLSGSTKPPTS